jgi:hypothetical protein
MCGITIRQNHAAGSSAKIAGCSARSAVDLRFALAENVFQCSFFKHSNSHVSTRGIETAKSLSLKRYLAKCELQDIAQVTASRSYSSPKRQASINALRLSACSNIAFIVWRQTETRKFVNANLTRR